MASNEVRKAYESDASPLHRYLLKHMTPLNPHLAKLHAASLQDEMAKMLGASEELNFLQMLMSSIGARKTLDIGVFTGYSSLAAALVLPPDGKVVACDVTDKWVNQYGRAVWKEAGVEDKIDLYIAPALDTLNSLLAAGEGGTFDFAFIDADKPSYVAYYEAALRLLRVGGIIAVDNALYSGQVAGDEAGMNVNTLAIHRLNEKAARDPRVHASLLNVGDGLLLCRRIE